MKHLKNGIWFIKESIRYVNPNSFYDWAYLIFNLPIKTIKFIIQMSKDEK